MDGQGHTGEEWMERNLGGVMAGTQAAQRLAAEAADREAGGDGEGHEQQGGGQFQHSHGESPWVERGVWVLSL